MRRKQFVISRKAHLEYLEETAFYFERGGADLGGRFRASIQRALEVIREAPGRFPRCAGPDYRCVLVKGFPFTVIYRDLPNQIRVLAIAHHKRRPGYWR